MDNTEPIKTEEDAASVEKINPQDTPQAEPELSSSAESTTEKTPAEESNEAKQLTPEDIERQKKNDLFEWAKLYSSFILFFNAVLLIMIIFSLAYNQKRISFLKEQNKELKKTIEPLRDFYNQKDKLIKKVLYDRQQEQIITLQKEKVDLLNNIKNSKQMIINLSRSLQVAESINRELEEEKSGADMENKNLSRDLKFEKMKSNIKPNKDNNKEK